MEDNKVTVTKKGRKPISGHPMDSAARQRRARSFAFAALCDGSIASECWSYKELVEQLRECGCTETPDGVAYNDSGLDCDALDEAMMDLRED